MQSVVPEKQSTFTPNIQVLILETRVIHWTSKEERYVLSVPACRAASKSFTVSKNAYSFGRINPDRMYEKVRRENNIVTVRGGGGITVQASGF